MTRLDGLRRYIEAASSLGEITRSKAEALVRELAASGEIERAHAKEWVDTLVKESKKRSDFVIDQVRHEVNRQISDLRYQTAEEAARRVLKIVSNDNMISLLRDLGQRAIGDIIGGTMPGAPRTTRGGGNKADKAADGDMSTTGESAASKSAPKSPAKKPATRRVATTTSARSASTRTKSSGTAAAKTSSTAKSSTAVPAKTSAKTPTKSPAAKSAVRNTGSKTSTRSSSSTTRTSPKR